jgi:two-component system chemotaxis response regulator CheY
MPKDLKALLMDDKLHQLSRTITILEHAGWKVTGEGTPAEALSRLSNEHFDAAILDYEMNDPNANGLDVLRTIRQDSNLDDLCVIMLTERAPRSAAVECVRAGAFHCVDKAPGLNLDPILCSGIAMERAHSLRRELVAQKDLKNATAKVRRILTDVLRRATCFIAYFPGNGSELRESPADQMNLSRAFVQRVLTSKRALLELSPSEIAPLEPITADAKEILTTPITGPNGAVTGIIHIEAEITS